MARLPFNKKGAMYILNNDLVQIGIYGTMAQIYPKLVSR